MFRKAILNRGKEPWIPREWGSGDCQKLEKKKAEGIDLNSDRRSIHQVARPSILEDPNLYDSFDRDRKSQIATNARKSGVQMLTTLQNVAFHNIIGGKIVVISASAATGKTMGYLIPLLQKVMENLQADPKREDKKPRAIIVVPTKEHMMTTYRTAIALAASASIRLGVYSSDMGGTAWKDLWVSSDVVISTDEMIVEALFGRSNMSMEKTITLVLDGIEDFQKAETEAILAAYNRLDEKPQLIIVANDVYAIKKSVYWSKIILSFENMVALVTEEYQRLTPCNHALLRVNAANVDEAVLRLVNGRNNGVVVVVIGEMGRNAEELLERVEKTLKHGGVKYHTYRTELSMNHKEDIVQSMLHSRVKVLLVKYCKELKGLKFPGVVEVIHVGMPPNFGYISTTSMVALRKNCRSVLLVNVDEEAPMAKELGTLVTMIKKSTESDLWASANTLPDWAQALLEFHEVQEARGLNEDRRWDIDDIAAAKMLSDIPEPAVTYGEFRPNFDIQESIAERGGAWMGGARRGGARREDDAHSTNRNDCCCDYDMAQEQPTRRRIHPPMHYDDSDDDSHLFSGLQTPMPQMFHTAKDGSRHYIEPLPKGIRRAQYAGYPGPVLTPFYFPPSGRPGGPREDSDDQFIKHYQTDNRRPRVVQNPPEFRLEKIAAARGDDSSSGPVNGPWPICCPAHMMNADRAKTEACTLELGPLQEHFKKMDIAPVLETLARDPVVLIPKGPKSSSPEDEKAKVPSREDKEAGKKNEGLGPEFKNLMRDRHLGGLCGLIAEMAHYEQKTSSEPLTARQIPKDEDGVAMGVQLTSGETINVFVPERMVFHMMQQLHEQRMKKSQREAPRRPAPTEKEIKQCLEEAYQRTHYLKKMIQEKEQLLQMKEEIMEAMKSMADEEENKEKAEEEAKE